MTQVGVRHGIDKLAADLSEIPARAAVDMVKTVREGLDVGNMLAKDFAKVSSRKHARKYPGTFSTRMNKGYRGATGNIYQGEYGPIARGQGNLATILERGSRKNPAHLNLERSADIIGPAFGAEVHRLPDRWFW